MTQSPQTDDAVVAATQRRADLWSHHFRPVPVHNWNARVPSPGKQPLGKDWPRHARNDPPFCATQPAVAHALNTGILCDGLRAIDIDVDDPDLAARCIAVCHDRLGPAPMRVRPGSARVLLLYRAAEGSPAKVSVAGPSGRIEALGHGQQFVAYGRHPSGAALTWSPVGPSDSDRDELPAITEAALLAFLAEAGAIIGADAPSQAADTPRPNGHDRRAAEPQAELWRISAALNAIPNHLPGHWDDWNRVGMALWGATGGSDAGLSEWITWSHKNPSYDEATTRKRWDAYANSPPTKLGAGTLLYLAAQAERDAGGENPDKQDNTAEPEIDTRPTIRCEAGIVDILVDQAEQALLDSGADVYQRADHLVRPGYRDVRASDGKKTIAAGLYELSDGALMEELSRIAVWERFDARSKKPVRSDPPSSVIKVLAGRKGKWRVRPINGVITCPTMRPDGSILSKPGYDTQTGLFYQPDLSLLMPPIPAEPTRADAEKGLQLLDGLLTEFPFVAEVHKSVALSLIISSVVRGALLMVPFHAFTAPAPGSGKSYLADIATTIISGRPCPVIAAGKTEEELEKRVGSMVLAGYQTISLDNLSTELAGDALCQLTERPTVRVRILGKSKTPECEFRGIFTGNGNNLVVAGDMTRRTLLGKLDTGLERPEEREYKAEPVKTVLADRGKYVAAALTIVRAYLVGEHVRLKPLISYGTWSDLVRSPLVWLGRADPVASMQEVRDNDPVLNELRAVLLAWKAAFGDAPQTSAFVASSVAGFDPDGPLGTLLTDLRAALVPVAAVRNVIDATRLRYWLRRSNGRPAGGLKLTGVGVHGSVMGWSVTPAGAGRAVPPGAIGPG